MPHRNRLIIVIAISVASGSCSAQQTTGSLSFKARADITHNGNSVVVDALEPRPLKQAVEGVAEEYG